MKTLTGHSLPHNTDDFVGSNSARIAVAPLSYSNCGSKRSIRGLRGVSYDGYFMLLYVITLKPLILLAISKG